MGAFFCDTNVIHGFCHKNDFALKRNSCKYFLNKYPCNINDYFIPQIVKDELNHQKYVENRDAGQKLSEYEHDVIRKFTRCVDAFLREVEIFSTEKYGNPYLKDLAKLKVALQSVINIKARNQINDIEVTAEAIFWSLLTEYDSHNYLTTDRNDIANKSKRILRKANQCLNTQIKLEICDLINYYKIKNP